MTEPGQPLTRRAARDAAAARADRPLPEGLSADATQPYLQQPPAPEAQLLATLAAPAQPPTQLLPPSSIPPAAPLAQAPAQTSRGLGDRLRGWAVAHRRTLLASGASIVVAALCCGAVAVGAASAARPEASGAVAAMGAVSARTVPTDSLQPTRARSCGVDVRDPAYATLGVSVVNVASGEQLLALGGGAAVPTTNLQKVLTAVTALKVLGPDTRIATRVYEGSMPGSIVLVGGGDPTLSALPAGTESVYAGAPRMSELAAQTTASLAKLYPQEAAKDKGKADDKPDKDKDPLTEKIDELKAGLQPSPSATPTAPTAPPASVTPAVTQLIVDTTLWPYGDSWDTGWSDAARTTGTQAPITPLMVDGDRADPTAATSPRGTDPIASATAAFIDALGQSTAPTIGSGEVVDGRPLLAEVFSQPVSVLVQQMLQADDNTLADMLARLVSTTLGSGGSAASLDQVFRSVLSGYEMPIDGLVVRDGSGLNAATVASPELVARMFATLDAGGAELQTIPAALPVAGQSGSLADRFSGQLASVKSAFSGVGGTTDRAATLGGLLTASDGTRLAVSLQASGEVKPETSLALETLLADIQSCGDNLAGILQ
ncbi:D-alanyl-D-alanine carboxypeptidase/D-alanyl-D-alanine-endopeptidase (penicillin-binding protein 4) [Homoserinimonas aerilata]|uniref:D-alanyl-D-alanine carboxypeptidase/D-alanyl-D-alanine-endopeptidase (Penicillin-binding protein 4) n=1 Tax=Homoserinimonas aerilata TaxID=1162970 RepID=A0A542YKV6_9MICO|nr:D-alanyl-D-alanine carboxypeptidase [Homoserinimonas aerilata]TQL48729.1 D-alanyl-D-alanine carboxypeptidase/D-alanyl-D-alanine-endopeptidase (penicillin-binding protein 4) [Homoserinimonas aerilata]